MRTVIIGVVLYAIGLTASVAQGPRTLLNPPINSPTDESNPVMLPDSSIMLSAHTGGKNLFEWRCVRYEYQNGKWKQAPAQLDSLINSLMFSSAVPSFRFSADFNLVTVTLQDGDHTRFF